MQRCCQQQSVWQRLKPAGGCPSVSHRESLAAKPLMPAPCWGSNKHPEPLHRAGLLTALM